MKITLTTHLPDNTETLNDIKEIIKFASLKLDVQLSISQYGDNTEMYSMALNNKLLDLILEEIEEEIRLCK